MIIKIGIAGISGRIGQRLVALLEKYTQMQVVCGLVSKQTDAFANMPYSVDTSCPQEKIADLWIDFSTPLAFDKVLNHCYENKTALISGTTGLSQKQFQAIEKAAEIIPILWASNFSIAINLIQQMLSKYANLVETSAKIIETHHIHKIDKPSGTAISLAKSLRKDAELITIDENNFRMDDVKILAIREAEIAGIHQIELENDAESISINHRAKTPEIFAQGAINAGIWLLQQEKGQYCMNDFIDSLENS